jgi:hypothetical protein
MLITYWIWSACPPRLRSKGNQIGYPDKPEVCRTRSTVTFYNRALHDAINVFDPVTLLELRRAAHLCQILRPASRDQIRDRAVRQRSSVIRQRCQRHQQRTTRVTGFPPTSDPSVISSRLDLQKHHQDQARTSAIKSPIPGSLQINLLFTIRTKQANSLKRDANSNFPRKTIHVLATIKLGSNHPYRTIVRRRSFGAPSAAKRSKIATA